MKNMNSLFLIIHQSFRSFISTWIQIVAEESGSPFLTNGT